jgi:hypothetical protein
MEKEDFGRIVRLRSFVVAFYSPTERILILRDITKDQKDIYEGCEILVGESFKEVGLFLKMTYEKFQNAVRAFNCVNGRISGVAFLTEGGR